MLPTRGPFEAAMVPTSQSQTSAFPAFHLNSRDYHVNLNDRFGLRAAGAATGNRDPTLSSINVAQLQVSQRHGSQGTPSGIGTVAPARAVTVVDLTNGIDEGPVLTQSGRLKRRREEETESDDENTDVTPPAPKSYRDASIADFPFKQRSYHIRRAFDLFCSIHTIINNGLKREARASEEGLDIESIQSNRDFKTYRLIMEHLTGLDSEIVRLRNNPMEFRFLLRKIKHCADNARNNDTAGLKKDVPLLFGDGETTVQTFKRGRLASSKYDRGFQNDIIGRYLCPVSMNWDDAIIRQKIRNSQLPITADDFPRLLYQDCVYNSDDPEDGFGRNSVLIRVVKYILTGRSSAFSDTPGGKTTRAGNAEIAGMKSITPRVIAYGACMLRFALSTQESWSKSDGEFNLQDFYWNVVEVFEGSGQFGEELIAWWNKEIFGRSTAETSVSQKKKTVSTLEHLRAHRRARHLPPLSDTTHQE